MSSIKKSLALTCLLTFSVGLWWGLYTTESGQHEKTESYDIKVLSLTDALSHSLSSFLEKELQIKISLTYANDINQFIELAGKTNYDLLFYKSYFTNQVLQAQNLSQLSVDKIKNILNIQADFWPSQKYNSKKSLPYAWGINGYSTLKIEEINEVNTKENSLYFFSKNYDYFFHYLYNIYPEIKNWIQNSKQNHIRELLKSQSTHVSFYSQLSPQILQHYVSSTNSEHAKISSSQPGLRFVIPDTGGLFWMNFISLTETGTTKIKPHEIIDFLLSRKSQLYMTSNENLSSITELEENFFQSAKYIRQIPISKIYFPLDTSYDPESWVTNLKIAFPDISNSNEDSLKD